MIDIKGEIYIIKGNFGCGKNILKGFINCDLNPINKKVKKIDFNILPLPFKKEFFDFILMEHTFEHLDINRMEFMRDIWRILKIDGKIKIIVPVNAPRVQHTIFYFDRHYFDSLDIDNLGLGKHSNRISYNNIFFKVEVFLDEIKNNKRYYIFKFFPFLRDIFPYLIKGEYTFILTKKSMEIKK